MKEFFTPDFLRFFLPLIGAVVAWFWNEHRKRSEEDYIRKERKYEALVESLPGFYRDLSSTPEGRALKQRFLLELNKMWLYCPDKVIQSVYAFLATIHTDRACTDAEKETALGNLMLAIRLDLLSRKPTKRSNLKSGDFKHLKSN